MKINCDFLVLGSGIAGLSFALKAAAHGTVAVVTKREITESATNYAQGGIASVFSQEDTFAAHIDDTLVAGAGICHEDIVRMVSGRRPANHSEPDRLGGEIHYQRRLIRPDPGRGPQPAADSPC